MKTYEEAKQAIADAVIEKISIYVKENNLTYTADAPDFIRGLLLGLEVGTTSMYDMLQEIPPDSP